MAVYRKSVHAAGPVRGLLVLRILLRTELHEKQKAVQSEKRPHGVQHRTDYELRLFDLRGRYLIYNVVFSSSFTHFHDSF